MTTELSLPCPLWEWSGVECPGAWLWDVSGLTPQFVRRTCSHPDEGMFWLAFADACAAHNGRQFAAVGR